MISTKPKEEKSKAQEVFEQYIALEQEDRSSFMNKVTAWLKQRVEAAREEERKIQEDKKK